MPTEKYAGWDAVFLVSALSPSQFWIANTTDALIDQPTSSKSISLRSVPADEFVAREHCCHGKGASQCTTDIRSILLRNWDLVGDD